MFTEQQLAEIRALISGEKTVTILTHYNPDGDAVGSSLGLKHFLKSLDIEATVIVPNDFPKFLKWMPEARKILIADYKRKKAAEQLEISDVVFILDFNASSRAGEMVGKWLDRSQAVKILIDHHQQPDSFDFVYSDTAQPATSQMVYKFAKALVPDLKVPLEMAQPLYTGIMTDTGGFRYRSTSAETHRIIAELIEAGADPAQISADTWDTNSLSRMKLLAMVLGRLQITAEGHVAILSLTRAELQEYGFEKGDTEGFVNYGLSLRGVQLAAFFMEDLYEDFIKISFRSKDDVDVNSLSRKYFNGGGHINAAGGKYYKSLDRTIEDFKEIVENPAFMDATFTSPE